MKILEQELDKTIINKLNQLEEAKTATENSYITYENSKFISKPISSLTLNKIFSMDDVYKLEKHLYKSEENYVSSFDTELIGKNITSYATSMLLNTLSGSFQFKTENKIIKEKDYDTFILALDSSGKLYKINKSDISLQSVLNAYDIIKSNFVYQNFKVYNIVDFEIIGSYALVATDSNGIYCLSFTEQDYQLKISEPDVAGIKLLKDNKSLLIFKSTSKNNIVMYDLTTNKKIAVYNQLSKYNQTVRDSVIENKKFFMLGKSYSSSQADNLIHGWMRDIADIGYDNLDAEIHSNDIGSNYFPKFIRSDDISLYVLGIKNGEIFIWDYDKTALYNKPREIYLQKDISYEDLKDFAIINGRYYIAIKSRLIVLDSDFKLIENYLLSGTTGFDFINITNSGVYAFDDRQCFVYKIPAKIYEKVTNIYIDNSGKSNNIDILIKMPEKDQVIFLNSETNSQFSPAYHIVVNGDLHVIKLSNVNATKINMKIGTYETDRIYGIVIHKNRIFYK